MSGLTAAAASRTQVGMSTLQSRKPEGIPSGGQFDSMPHAEAPVSLAYPAPDRCDECGGRPSPDSYLCRPCEAAEAEKDQNPLFDETPPTKIAYVDPFPGRNGKELEWDNCKRCGGEGIMTQFRGTLGGICFECQGGKGEMRPIAALRRREQGRVRRVNQANMALHDRRMFHNTNVKRAMELNPAAEGWLNEINTDPFLADVWEKAFKYELSEKQLAAVGGTFDRRKERTDAKAAAEAAAVEVPKGRYVITGEVLSTNLRATGFGTTILKMTLRDERGFRVHGTAPSSLIDAIGEEEPGRGGLTGRKISFTAAVTPTDEKGFGYFSRPTKASMAS